MSDDNKKDLYFKRLNILLKKGIEEGDIVPFDDKFYEQLSHTYDCGIPISIHMKYLKPSLPPMHCYDRSLYMFLCFDDSLLVRGNTKDLEYKYGEDSGHGWMELDDYVYEPTSLLRFKKKLYYDMYLPTNVCKYSKSRYLKENKEFYDNMKNTTLDDYKPGGKKRMDLCLHIPLIQCIANNSNDEEFKKELALYLELIEYDEREVCKEFNLSFQEFLKEESSIIKR